MARKVIDHKASCLLQSPENPPNGSDDSAFVVRDVIVALDSLIESGSLRW